MKARFHMAECSLSYAKAVHTKDNTRQNPFVAIVEVLPILCKGSENIGNDKIIGGKDGDWYRMHLWFPFPSSYKLMVCK